MADETGYLQSQAARYGTPLSGMPGAGGGFSGLMNQEPVVTVSVSDRRATPSITARGPPK